MSQRVRAGWVGAALAAAVALGAGAACTSDAPQDEPAAVDAGPPMSDSSSPAPAGGKAGIKVSAPTSASTSESGGATSFTVVLSSKPKGTVVVTIASTKPAEGAPDASALTFTAESWATPQTVTVTGVDDPNTDGDQPYAIAIGPVQSSDARYAALDPDDVALTNSDDDVAGLVVSVPSPSPTVNEAGASAAFTVHLRAKPVGDVRVPLVVSKPLEAKVEPQELVFTAADYATPKAVVVTGKDDAVADGDQPFTVSLGPAVSAHAAYAGVTSPALAFTNQDDDIAGFLVGSATPTTHTSEAGGAVTVSVRLRSMPEGDVTIPVSTSKPSEGTASVASLTFTPADYATPQTVTVTGVGDFVDDGDQSYALVLGAASSADAKYQGLDAPDVALTNDDDDTAGVTVSAPTPGSTTSEAGGQVSFTVVLKSQPTADVTIPVASSNTAEGTVDKASLMFTPADWDTPQTVTVTGADDATLDADQAYSIVLGAALSVDALYNGLNPTDVALTNARSCHSLAFAGNGQVAVSGGVPSEIAGNNTAKHVEAWVRPTASGAALGIVHLGNDPGGCGTPACGGVTFRVYVSNGTLALDVSQAAAASAIAVPTNEWTFVFAGFVPGSGYYVGKVAADGTVTRAALSLGSVTQSSLTSGQASRIGVNLGSSSFTGGIDLVRIWSRNPSNGEIAARFKSRLVAANEVGLVRQWWTHEGAGGTTVDDVTSAASTLTNATWQATCPP